MTKFFLIVLLFLSTVFVNAQITEDNGIDALIEEFLTSENEMIDELVISLSNINLLYFSTTFNSESYFAGRDIGYNQFNISPQLTYANSNGIYAGIGGSYFSEFNPKWDATIVFLGYADSFDKKEFFNYNIGFSKYFYSKNEDNIFGNAIDLGLTIRNKNKWIGTQLTGTYLFGEESSYQLLSKTFLSLKLLRSTKSSLKFKPNFSIIAGKQTYLERNIIIVNGIRRVIISEKTAFDLLNKQVQLPVQLRYSNFDFEIGYTFNFPYSPQKNIDLSSNSFLNFSVGYLLPL